jgi:hypothetical protein
MEEYGYSGLADRRKGKPSAQRIPLATVEEVLRLYREEYFDLNIRHFHEKLEDKHKIHLSYTLRTDTVKYNRSRFKPDANELVGAWALKQLLWDVF